MSGANKICVKCSKSYFRYFTLDCQHAVCLTCLSQYAQYFEQSSQLIDECQLTCQKCSYITEISMLILNKILRQNKNKEYISNEVREKVLVCLDCLKQCFSLDEYLAGRHAGHQVKSIDKAYPIIENHMEKMSEELKQSVELLHGQNNRLCQQKKMLNDLCNGNLMKIKIMFENIRETVDSKENQIRNLYENSMLEKFQLLNQEIVECKQKINQCQLYNQWIQNNGPLSGIFNEEQKFKQIRASVHFYFENQQKISSFQSNELSRLQHDKTQRRKTSNCFKKQHQQFSLKTQEVRQIVEKIRQLVILKKRQFIEDVSQVVHKPIFEGKSYFLRKKQEIFSQSDSSSSSVLGEKNQEIVGFNSNIKKLRFMINS